MKNILSYNTLIVDNFLFNNDISNPLIGQTALDLSTDCMYTFDGENWNCLTDFDSTPYYTTNNIISYIEEYEFVDINCPNCGAPITDKNDNNCPYCGTIYRKRRYRIPCYDYKVK